MRSRLQGPKRSVITPLTGVGWVVHRIGTRNITPRLGTIKGIVATH